MLCQIFIIVDQTYLYDDPHGENGNKFEIGSMSSGPRLEKDVDISSEFHRFPIWGRFWEALHRNKIVIMCFYFTNIGNIHHNERLLCSKQLSQSKSESASGDKGKVASPWHDKHPTQLSEHSGWIIKNVKTKNQPSALKLTWEPSNVKPNKGLFGTYPVSDSMTGPPFGTISHDMYMTWLHLFHLSGKILITITTIY